MTLTFGNTLLKVFDVLANIAVAVFGSFVAERRKNLRHATRRIPESRSHNKLQQRKRKTGDSVKLLRMLYQVQNYVLKMRSVDENITLHWKATFLQSDMGRSSRGAL